MSNTPVETDHRKYSYSSFQIALFSTGISSQNIPTCVLGVTPNPVENEKHLAA